MIRDRFRLGVLVTFAIAMPGELPAEESASRLGKQVSPFQLQDFRGKEVTLTGDADAKLTVVAFLGTECPLAKLYALRLNRLFEEFHDRGVSFLGIDANAQDSVTEMAAFARRHQVEFPLLKDVGNRVADQMGAIRTPEVYVLDQEQIIRYVGRIDDQYGVGTARNEPTREDLRVALEELLAGSEVSTAVTQAPGCFIGRIPQPQPDADSGVTYCNQIARILQRNCLECHRDGDIAPFALTDYDEVVGWAQTIAEVIHDQRMPPWHASQEHGVFANERRLTAEEVSLVDRWIAAGVPRGNASDLPAPVAYQQGWSLPRAPDRVVPMSEEPRIVSAEGVIDYQYLRVDPGFEEDKWVEAVQVRPGNRAVVHHILVFIERADGSRDEFAGGVRGFMAGYVPGFRAAPYGEGMAKLIPAGSKLIFQMHYTPVGTEQADLSHIGFLFTDPEQVKYEVKTISAFQPNIRIPKREANHPESTKTKVHEPVRLLGFMPHMHVRGKAFRYLARFPGELTWETLIDIPRYDFNWQTNYRLAVPIELPAETLIKCEAVYDNSVDNLSNPDPERTVGWGDQTWDEMLIGYFDVAVPMEDRGQSAELSAEERAQRRAEEFILQMDQNDDLALQLREVPGRMKLVFLTADKDRDGRLTTDEVLAFFASRRRSRG